MTLKKIVSGGQTGADRAALDVALELKFPCGGWCPAGRIAEDGPIPDRYPMQETPTNKYIERTKWNVRDADGTVIFTTGEEISGGSLNTLEYARELRKPSVHIHRGSRPSPAQCLLRFIEGHGIKTLNVAGPRSSNDLEIYRFVYDSMIEVFVDL